MDGIKNTVVDGIYALGDVTGEGTNSVAIKAGRTLSGCLFNGKTNAKMDYDYPYCCLLTSNQDSWFNRGSSYQSTAKITSKVNKSSFASMYSAVYKPSSRISLQTHHHGYGRKSCWTSRTWLQVDEMIQGFAVAIKDEISPRQTLMLQ